MLYKRICYSIYRIIHWIGLIFQHLLLYRFTTYSMNVSPNQRIHIYNHKNGDENILTTHLCTKDDLKYCECLYSVHLVWFTKKSIGFKFCLFVIYSQLIQSNKCFYSYMIWQWNYQPLKRIEKGGSILLLFDLEDLKKMVKSAFKFFWKYCKRQFGLVVRHRAVIQKVCGSNPAMIDFFSQFYLLSLSKYIPTFPFGF